VVVAGRSLVDAMRVQQLHDYYLDLLAYEIERSHVSTHSRILIKIFQLLPLLVPINAEQAVAIMNLRVDAPPGYLLTYLLRVFTTSAACAGVWWQAGCLISVTFVYCVETAKATVAMECE